MTFIVLAVVVALDQMETLRYQQRERSRTLEQLGGLRATAENAISERVHLTLGLKAHVSMNPNITRDDFETIAAMLMSESRGIRSMTLIRDNVITAVHPREGNESAIGFNILDDLKQQAGARRAIENRKRWLAGPVELIQGGRAFIDRAPVFVPEEDGVAYWGMVSTLIDEDVVLSEIRGEVPDGLQIAIRGVDGRGASGGFFLGESSILESRPATMEINLPTGSWQLLGIPKEGWPSSSPATYPIRVAGVVAAALGGLLIFFALRARRRVFYNVTVLEQKNREIEIAEARLRRYTDELEKSNYDLEEFTRVVSHDLQAPLRAVHNLVGWISEDASEHLPSDSLRNLDLLRSRVEVMQRLITDLLAYSRVGRDAGHVENVDTRQLVESVRNQLDIPRGFQLLLVGEFPVITTRATPLQTCIRNLVANAIKHHDREEGAIEVCCDWLSDRAEEPLLEFTQTQPKLEFVVRDDGPGIEPSHHDRIFGIFQTLGAKDGAESSGMGLAIVKRLIELNGGRVSVDSKLGDGAAFHFTWPTSETCPRRRA